MTGLYPALTVNFGYIFGLLLLTLFLAKGGLTFYRIATRVWPPSWRYLWKIIDWQAEAKKILILILFSFLLSLLISY